ncbi:MAG: hypothetical protein KKB50_17835 [Planctomycetes bacterium]|nr:hypothetical protein [Planctomycetota bacterium]
MSAARPSKSRAGWLHAALLLVIVGECAVALVGHRSVDELKQVSETGTPTEKVYAIHILANRDEPQILTRDYMRSMLRLPDVLMHELAMTTNFSRLRPAYDQAAFVASLPEGGEKTRCRILLDSRLGLGGHLTPEKIRLFYDSLRAEDSAQSPAGGPQERR